VGIKAAPIRTAVTLTRRSRADLSRQGRGNLSIPTTKHSVGGQPQRSPKSHPSRRGRTGALPWQRGRCDQKLYRVPLVSSAPVTDGLRLRHETMARGVTSRTSTAALLPVTHAFKAWASPRALPYMQVHRGDLTLRAGLSLCRLPGVSSVTRDPPVRPSALTPRPGRSGMPSGTRRTQYEGARKTGDRE